MTNKTTWIAFATISILLVLLGFSGGYIYNLDKTATTRGATTDPAPSPSPSPTVAATNPNSPIKDVALLFQTFTQAFKEMNKETRQTEPRLDQPSPEGLLIQASQGERLHSALATYLPPALPWAYVTIRFKTEVGDSELPLKGQYCRVIDQLTRKELFKGVIEEDHAISFRAPASSKLRVLIPGLENLCDMRTMKVVDTMNENPINEWAGREQNGIVVTNEEMDIVRMMKAQPKRGNAANLLQATQPPGSDPSKVSVTLPNPADSQAGTRPRTVLVASN